MANSESFKINVEPNSKIEVINLSKADYDFLISTAVPKAKRSFLWVSVIFIELIPIMPYFPARITGRTLIEKMSYESAIQVSCLLSGILIFLTYYFGIVQLRRDIRQGHKCRYITSIKRKTWRGNSKFEIELDYRPKNVREKIFLDRTEYYNWLKDEVVEIEFLKRAGRILNYRKVATT